MQEYITELSKYFITICMAIYTYEGFAVFRFKEEASRNGIYIRQNILIFFIQFFSFMTICLKSGNIEYLFFYAIVQLILFSILVLTRMLYPRANRLILNNMCMLLGIGFIILARLSFNQAIKQLVIVILSLIITMLIPELMAKFKLLNNMTWVYAGIGVAALSAVLILGQVTHGSKLSFSIGGVSFQPSEFVKILFVFYLAATLWKDSSLKNVAMTAVVSGLHVIILVVSKDLGSALIFFVAYVMIVFIATKNYWYLLIGAMGGVIASVLAYQLFTHVQVRVQAWLDPWTYIDSQGYQITQSLFALGSGSWFGLGLFGGTPEVIPYVEADFIFSAICEEMGILFGLCVILVCISCFIMIMNISVRTRNRFYQLVAFGLGIIYIFQIFLTIGGGIKFIPLTGVTLPLISYGGSSVLTTLIMFFIIQGLYILRQQEGDKRVVKRKREELLYEERRTAKAPQSQKK